MPSVREILKMNGFDLDISEAALNLEFDGNFIFSGTEKELKGDIENHPGEFALGYVFYNGNDRLSIVPDDPDYVVNYTRFYDDKEKGYFQSYGSDGLISIIM